MTNSLQEQSQSPKTDPISTLGLNRRAFLFTAASACGVAILAASRPSFAAAASGGAGVPGTVTIVQFSDAGKATGKISVPRVVKSEAEWKQKLSPISFEVTRHDGTERAYSGITWNNHDHGFVATTPSSARRLSLNQAPAGRASGSPLPRKISSRLPTEVWAWSARLSPAASAMPISATSSMTAPAPPAFATA
jgi:hypothetical protein